MWHDGVKCVHDANAAEFEAARRICRHHARSFYFASFFLPVRKRLAAYAVYAFCRLIDPAMVEIFLVHERQFIELREQYAETNDKVAAKEEPITPVAVDG